MHRLRGAAAAILLLSAPAALPWPVSAGLFHLDEPRTTREIGPGFRASGRVYFIASYRLWRPAWGIAAFPDGGMPRVLFARTSLYRLDPKSKTLDGLAVLEEENLPGNNVKNSCFSADKKSLSFAYISSNNRTGGRWAKWSMSSWALPSGRSPVPSSPASPSSSLPCSTPTESPAPPSMSSWLRPSSASFSGSPCLACRSSPRLWKGQKA